MKPHARLMLGCAASLTLVVGILYARTRGFMFLRLDDYFYTAGCPFVVEGLTWESIGEAFNRFRYGGVWMPLTYISYMADITLWGGGWGVHHAVNAALHALNTLVVFTLFVALLPRVRRVSPQVSCLAAFLAALVWAVHPQRVEAVAWIASRKEELFTLFTLLGLAAWSRGARGAGAACCALACLSKPTAVCFAPLALLVDLSGFGQAPKRLRDCLRYVPLFAMALATGLVALASQSRPEGMAEIALTHVPFLTRLCQALAALGLYLAQTLVPWGVHFDYLDNAHGLTCLAVCLSLVALLCWRVPSARRLVVVCGLFYLIALAPVLGLFGSFGEHARADRFVYLPSVACAFALAVALCAGVRAQAAAACVALAFAVLAWPVVGSYRNDYTAFARALRFAPDHWRALQHVGSEYCARLGRMSEGLDLLRTSYRLSPRDSTAEALVYALACRGDTRDAAEIFRLAAKVAKAPGLDKRGMMCEALGVAETWAARWDRAETYLRASLAAPQRFYSRDAANLALADVLAHKGDTAGARALLRPLALSEKDDVRHQAFAALDALNRRETPVTPEEKP